MLASFMLKMFTKPKMIMLITLSKMFCFHSLSLNLMCSTPCNSYYSKYLSGTAADSCCDASYALDVNFFFFLDRIALVSDMVKAQDRSQPIFSVSNDPGHVSHLPSYLPPFCKFGVLVLSSEYVYES